MGHSGITREYNKYRQNTLEADVSTDYGSDPVAMGSQWSHQHEAQWVGGALACVAFI